MDEIKESIKNMSLEELRDYYAGNLAESRVGHYANVEFQFRQTKYIKEQAEAAISSNESIRKDSKIMLCTLIFIAIAPISQLIIAISSTLNS